MALEYNNPDYDPNATGPEYTSDVADDPAVRAATAGQSDWSGFQPVTPAHSEPGPKMTEFGPAIDPPGSQYFDHNSWHGIGDRNNQLTHGFSVALTQSERAHRFGITGSSTGQIFEHNGRTYRDDDTAPESDRRIDVYKAYPGQPGGDVQDWGEFKPAGSEPTAKADWSGFKPVVERALPVGADQESYGASMAAQAKPDSSHPSDLGKFVDNIWKNAQATGAEIHKGAAQATVNQPQGANDPYDLAIQEAQTNPDLNDAQKAEEIQKLRDQQAQTQKANVAAVPQAVADEKAAQAQLDQQYQTTLPGRVSRVIGSTLPYVASGVTGPMAGFAAATQMTASAYGETLDKSSRRLKELHPDWSDDQILVAANNAATESAKAAGESGLALSFVNIPAAGPLITRIVQKLGITDASMTLAQIYAKVQENLAIKKNVDPSQDILDGLKDVAINGLASNWLLGVPHAVGEIGARTPAETPKPLTATEPLPEQQNATETQRGAVVEENGETTREQTAQEPVKPQEPAEKVVAAALRAGEKIYTGKSHLNAIDQADADPDYNGQKLEEGFVTNTGRFLTREEARKVDPSISTVAAPRRKSTFVKPEPVPWTKPETPFTETVNSFRAKEPEGGLSPETQETEQWVSAIANRYAQERSEAGEIGEIAPGQGYSRTDLREVGLRMSPEEINQHVSDLMHNTGDPKLQAAAITAEEARLSQRSSQLSRSAESNPGDRQAQIDAENAFHDLTDFHNGPVAKLKNNWHAQGMTLQGEVPVDLSTFNGLREAWLRDVGKAPPEGVEATMRRTAAQVRVATQDEAAAMAKLSRSIDQSSSRAKIPSAEEVRNAIMERMQNEPCIIG